MKKLITLFYRLTMKDYQSKVDSARKTVSMINASTNGRVSHFYNIQGDKIRGYHKRIKFNADVHPLITKYK
jgi:hypothetical protein